MPQHIRILAGGKMIFSLHVVRAIVFRNTLLVMELSFVNGSSLSICFCYRCYLTTQRALACHERVKLQPKTIGVVGNKHSLNSLKSPSFFPP